MTDESLSEIAKIMRGNRGVGGGHTVPQDHVDWGYSFDDHDPEFWEHHFGGPEDPPTDEQYYEGTSQFHRSKNMNDVPAHYDRVTDLQSVDRRAPIGARGDVHRRRRRRMRKLDSKIGEFWIGCHPSLGPVIYNPRSQRGLDGARVRLYKLTERAIGTFMKDIVREKITSPDESTWLRIESMVESYVSLLANRRVTHCFNCKQHLDAVEFSVCDSCGWIRCSCSACGCSYQSLPP